ncbi:MAG: carboxypeptidase regulatory-like domain-containing protein, partial [Candidatus Aminicenantes bacterium]|nr:carboxypeptidase regulatory-like domain-containing protein [Candidatus Aminicenantes bacterium]
MTGGSQSIAGVRRKAISGLIRDDQGPIAGAVVRIKGTAHSVLTGADGTFVLAGPQSDQAAAVTAWAPGYYIGGGQPVWPGDPKIVITLKKHDSVDHPGYSWLPSLRRAGQGENQGCAECHSRAGTNLSYDLPVDEWLQDLHSQSAVNPRFLTMYEGSDTRGRRSEATRYFSVKDYGVIPLPPDPAKPYFGPGYRTDFPETAGNCAACHTPAAAVNEPVTTDPRGLSGPAAEGVSCDFCHTVTARTGDPSFNFNYAVDPGKVKRGSREGGKS